jgi:HlyD family secretion protein
MIKLIQELFQFLTPIQRKRFYFLQFWVILMAFAEILGIASIAPFMMLVGDVSMLERDNFLSQLYAQTGLQDPYGFIFWVGMCVLLALALASIVSAYTTWKLSMFGAKIGTEIADRLYRHYMHQPWLYHASGSSAQLIKQIATESVRVSNGIIQPLMLLNARAVLAVILSVVIFSYNPFVAISGLVVFGLAYFLLYKLVRKQLYINGQSLSDLSRIRYQLMNAGFGGIKDVLLLNRHQDFVSRFEETGKKQAKAQGRNNGLQQVPRYLMEFVAFGSMIGLVLYFITAHQGNLAIVLPILAVYALASYKLLPAFQQIYSSIATIKGNISAFESIRNDLLASQTQTEKIGFNIKIKVETTEELLLLPQKSISLENISFTYPGKNKPVLNQLTMTIPANSTIGIVGPSGSGKSTVLDILLGLIEPQAGELKIDNILITDQNRRAWQNTIGFVSQSIFLSEGTIAENVAFGISQEGIYYQQVEKALKMAHLDEFVHTLEKGMLTQVGERGVQISGGQRQRIGIARALYQDAAVLVFDEATSALDGITEKMIMEAIHDFSGKKTIIMIAHRLKTVEQCDQILMIERGRVSAQGTYKELIENNEAFKRLATHA